MLAAEKLLEKNNIFESLYKLFDEIGLECLKINAENLSGMNELSTLASQNSS